MEIRAFSVYPGLASEHSRCPRISVVSYLFADGNRVAVHCSGMVAGCSFGAVSGDGGTVEYALAAQ